MAGGAVTEGSLAAGRRRFHTLDGMRGIAAVMIVLLHTQEYSAPFSWPGSYLAVDLFFVLSGVVLAEAYGGKLAQGMGLKNFLALRLIRLYPLYLAGTLLGLLPPLMVLWRGSNPLHWTGGQVATGLAFGLAMAPCGIQGNLFPLLRPAWSLFYELLANLGWASSGGSRLRGAALGLPMALAAAVLAACAHQRHSLDFGAEIGWSTAAVALARVVYSFGMGLCLHRWNRPGLPRFPALLLLAATLALLALGPPAGARGAYDLAAVLGLFPGLVLLAMATEPTSRFGLWLCTLMGAASYPLYVIHPGIFLILRGVSRQVLHQDPYALAPWPGLGLAALLIGLAWAADRCYDQPVRRWLMARWKGRSAA